MARRWRRPAPTSERPALPAELASYRSRDWYDEREPVPAVPAMTSGTVAEHTWVWRDVAARRRWAAARAAWSLANRTGAETGHNDRDEPRQPKGTSP